MGEDRDIRGDIEKFARDRFATKTDTRSPEDRLKVAAEANSLFKAYQAAESQALMRGAEVKAAQAAAKEIDHQASKMTQVICSFTMNLFAGLIKRPSTDEHWLSRRVVTSVHDTRPGGDSGQN